MQLKLLSTLLFSLFMIGCGGGSSNSSSVPHTVRDVSFSSVSIFPEKIIVRIVDKGPGIPDIDLAMQKGYSTASSEVREMGFGAGMGLPNIKKNTNELNIKSEVGVGTEVELINYLN